MFGAIGDALFGAAAAQGQMASPLDQLAQNQQAANAMFQQDRTHRAAFPPYRPGQVIRTDGPPSQAASVRPTPEDTLRYNDHKVYWEGWQSSTSRLAQSGWDIAVNYNPEYMAYRLFFNHKSMTLSAMTEQETFDDLVYQHVPFRISMIAPKIHVSIIPAITMSAAPRAGDFIPIDASIMQREVRDINPDNIFMYAKGENELLVDEANMEVVDHLEAIKALQSEKQKELREKARSGDAIIERKIISNVVELRVA